MSELIGDLGADSTDSALNGDDICLEQAAPVPNVRVQDIVAGEELRIPLVKEELTARVVPAEIGPIRIEKHVITEGREIDVPLTEEEVRVERRIVERPVNGSGTQIVEQIIIEIPVLKERVDIEKRAHIAEEIVVTKEVVQRAERVSDTIRREEVRIDEGDKVFGS